nr:hypothetical protein [uncultured Lachnoclostridium sp.]
MKESIFKVEKREDDLIRTDEYWQSSSFADMQSSLVKNLFIKKQYLPHRNMKVFRELSFLIKASVTVFKIQQLCKVIEKRFKIKCFQIAINRNESAAHLLFLWVNEDYESVLLTEYDWKHLTVLVIRFLNLPRPASTKPLIKSFLKDAYEENNEVFRNQLELIYNNKIPGLNYSVLRDALDYAEYMCKGDLK